MGQGCNVYQQSCCSTSVHRGLKLKITTGLLSHNRLTHQAVFPAETAPPRGGWSWPSFSARHTSSGSSSTSSCSEPLLPQESREDAVKQIRCRSNTCDEVRWLQSINEAAGKVGKRSFSESSLSPLSVSSRTGQSSHQGKTLNRLKTPEIAAWKTVRLYYIFALAAILNLSLSKSEIHNTRKSGGSCAAM